MALYREWGLMTRRSPHVPFETSHPSVALLYVLGTLGIVMFAPHPVYAGISLAGGLACSFALRGVSATLKGLRWQVPMLVLVCIANPLFTASGSTELWRLGSLVVYKESLAYGAMMGGVMVASILWFECAACLLPEDKVLALGGKALPTVSLMVSMAAQLVPQLVRHGQSVQGVQRACTAAVPLGNPSRSQDGNGAEVPARRAKLLPYARLSNMLMGWALEDSLERSDAMRARGWGARPPYARSTYQSYRFRASDAAKLVALGCLVGLNAFLAYVACSQWHFYPTMPRLVIWWGYVPFAVQVLLPTVMQSIAWLYWR